MNKRPQHLVPVNAPDSIVVIVEKNNHSSTIPAFFIVALLAGVAWWVTQGPPESDVPATVSTAEATLSASGNIVREHSVRPKQSHPASDAFASPSSPSAPFGRPAATFFDVTPEPAPEALPEAPKSTNPFGTPTGG